MDAGRLTLGKHGWGCCARVPERLAGVLVLYVACRPGAGEESAVGAGVGAGSGR